MTRREILKAERQELIKLLTELLWFTREESGKRLVWDDGQLAFYMGNKLCMSTRMMIDKPENIAHLVQEYSKEVAKDLYYTKKQFEIKGLSKQQAIKFAQNQKWI